PLFGKGETRLQPAFVEDVATAAARALERPDSRSRVYELGGRRIYSYRQILEAVVHHRHRRRLFLPVPFGVWELLAEAASRLPNPPLTVDQVRLLERDNTVGSGMATFGDLGIEAAGIEDKLAECLP
ncbi:MAG TPA: complex I NDUFA9 subunit family protein, partial [Gammaproteobacteria bacterium]|nr:complex I NDUFA9 subunit family protein [Gammaproteobacteria bacterium]